MAPSGAPTGSSSANPSATPTIVPTSGHTATPTPGPTSHPTATPTPAPTTAPALVDWPTYGYDAARDSFNPSTTAFTTASLGQLHTVWNVSTGGGTQPIVVTNVVPGHAAVVIIGTGDGHVSAYDAFTGATVWSTQLGRQNLGVCGTSGTAGTVQYDKALGTVYVAAGNGASTNHVILTSLSAATGGIVQSLDVSTNLLTGESTSAHTAITLANNTLYLGTGSNCEAASWRGSVIAVNPVTMSVTGTFYTTWNQGGAYGGGGVWGWGGVSADPSGNIFVGSGNAETSTTYNSGTISPPFVVAPNENSGYAEQLTEVNSNLSSELASNVPILNFAIGNKDLDFSGTPVVFQPPGCNELVAGQGKGGTLVVADTTNLAGSGNSYTLSMPSAGANYIGNPAYSPVTGLLYAAINSGTDSLYPPGLAAIASCGQSVMWHAQFGPNSFNYSGDNPRSAPTVTAGGVVFIGTPCTPVTASGVTSCSASGSGSPNGAVWALDASTGNVLGGGNPIVTTGDTIRMAPTVDGLWMWVCDQSGNLYGLTIDPTVTAKHRTIPVRLPRTMHWRS